MMLYVFLTSSVVVYGMFDITYPEGIIPNFTAQQFECEYDRDAELYPWNPHGSPLGLKLYIDKSLIRLHYCSGTNWQNYSDWDNCVELQSYVQPLAGNVCIKNVTDEKGKFDYGPVGTKGTLRIQYRENGDGGSLQCIPITISSDGPEWEGDNCETDENTGFQPFGNSYEALYGPILLDQDVELLVSMEYVTYTVQNGKTSAQYNYWITSSGGSSLLDLKTATTYTGDWNSPFVFITFTSDGTKILYNGAYTVYDWTSTESVNAFTFTPADTKTSSSASKTASSGSSSSLGTLLTLSGLMVLAFFALSTL